MADKEMNMLVTIGAIFRGERAFESIRKSAGSTANAIKKIALETAGIIIGFKAIQGVTDFFGGAIKEAQDARAATEKLGAALGRNPKIAAKGADVVLARTEQLKTLADEMERTGVIAGTSLKAGFAGLSGAGFSPEQITKYSEGFRGVVVGLQGIGASSSDVAQTTQQIRNFIKTGAPLPKAWNAIMTAQDKATLSNKVANTEMKRGSAIAKIMEKQTWRNAAAMETASGKAFTAAQNWRRIQETIGAPFVDTQLAFTEMWGEVALALEPISKEIADSLNPAMKDLAQWIRNDVNPALKEFTPTIKEGLGWVKENWEPISKGLGAIGVAAATLGVFAIISNPITLTMAALTGLAGAAVLVIDNWKLIGPALEDAGKAIAKSTEWLWKPIADGVGKVWPEIDAELKRMVKLIQSFFTGEIDLSALGQTMARGVGRIGESLGKVDWSKIATDIGTNIGNAFKSIDLSATAGNIGTGLSNAMGAVGGALATIDWSGVANAIGQGIGTAMKAIAWATFILPQDLYNGIVKVVMETNWMDLAGKLFESLRNASIAILSAGAWAVGMGAHIVAGIVKSLAGEGWGMLATELAHGFASGLQGVLKEVSGWGPKIAKAIMDGIGTLVPKFELPFGLGKSKAEVAGNQLGGIITNPTISTLAEKGPEAVIPLNRAQRSQGLLAQTASMMGMKGGGGGQNVSLSMPITVNGAQAGQEGAIAREIERLMQDPIRNLLDQLKEARDEEHRLAYV